MCSTLNVLEFCESLCLGVLLHPNGAEDSWGGMQLDRRVKGMEWCPRQVCWALQHRITCNACEVLKHIRGCLRTQTK